MFVDFLLPAVIDTVIPNYPGIVAGLQKGDSLVALNGKELGSWNDFTEALSSLKYKASVAPDKADWRQITLAVSRAGVTDTLSMRLDSTFMVGVAPRVLSELYSPKEIEYGFFESFPAGITHGVNVLKGYVNDMKYVFSKEGATSLGGFATIGSIFPTQWDWHRFWEMTAFLSIILAFMNILPIPALDGGHVLFLLYEIIARRKPSDKFMERAQIVGMALLLILLVWANFNDIMRFVF